MTRVRGRSRKWGEESAQSIYVVIADRIKLDFYCVGASVSFFFSSAVHTALIKVIKLCDQLTSTFLSGEGPVCGTDVFLSFSVTH